MAHQIFQLPKQIPLGAGRVFAGAKAYFYATGTTTPQNTFTTSTLSVANANPVVADAEGVFPPIYLDPSLVYKLTLQTSADVLIYTIDPVNDQLFSQAIIAGYLYPRTAAEIAAGVTPTNYAYPPLNVRRYGAVGDFEPSTGLGTDDATAIQSALTIARHVTGGAEVLFPPGRYLVGSIAVAYDATLNPGSGHIVLGVGGTPGTAENIIIRGEGAEIYQGVEGRMFLLYGCINTRITGLKFFGYRGGTLAAGRENDALMIIADRSRNIELDNCYMVCGFGDAVYINGDMNQVSFDWQPTNIRIHHNVLKQYFGNGTFVGSGGGGTQSRFCLAPIDIVGLNVHDNTIYGSIDLEPNNAVEHLIDIAIHNNKLKSGHVTAQGTIGTDYWHDEPVNYSGGSTISQVIALTSVAAAPIVSNVTVVNNTFESGIITCDGGAKKFALIAGNVFEVGWIRPAFSAAVSGIKIIDNVAYEPNSANDIFVELEQNVSNCEFSGNSARGANWSSCVGFSAGADTGGNIWGPNTSEVGTPTNVTPHATSQVAGVPIRIPWTPVVSFATPGDLSVTYAGSGQLGELVLDGKTVTANFRIVTSAFTHGTASGQLQITGLPYTARNATIAYEGSLRWQGLTLAANFTQVAVKIEPNTAVISFDMSGSAQSLTVISVTHVPTGGTVILIGSITYELP